MSDVRWKYGAAHGCPAATFPGRPSQFFGLLESPFHKVAHAHSWGFGFFATFLLLDLPPGGLWGLLTSSIDRLFTRFSVNLSIFGSRKQNCAFGGRGYFRGFHMNRRRGLGIRAGHWGLTWANNRGLERLTGVRPTVQVFSSVRHHKLLTKSRVDFVNRKETVGRTVDRALKICAGNGVKVSQNFTSGRKRLLTGLAAK